MPRLPTAHLKKYSRARIVSIPSPRKLAPRSHGATATEMREAIDPLADATHTNEDQVLESGQVAAGPGVVVKKGKTMSDNQEHLQHEAGDRVHVLAAQFQAAIREHPFIAENPNLAAQAQVIADQLGALYQAVWKE